MQGHISQQDCIDHVIKVSPPMYNETIRQLQKESDVANVKKYYNEFAIMHCIHSTTRHNKKGQREDEDEDEEGEEQALFGSNKQAKHNQTKWNTDGNSKFGANQKFTKEDERCYNCGMVGHQAYQCKKPRNQNQGRNSAGKSNQSVNYKNNYQNKSQRLTGTCHHCGKWGHHKKFLLATAQMYQLL